MVIPRKIEGSIEIELSKLGLQNSVHNTLRFSAHSEKDSLRSEKLPGCLCSPSMVWNQTSNSSKCSEKSVVTPTITTSVGKKNEELNGRKAG